MSLFNRVFKPQEYQNEKMMKAVIDMKMSQKNLTRQAKKMEQAAAKAKKKLRKALEKRDVETAKIHAESAVRSQSTARSFHQMAGRVDAVCGRMKEAMATQQLTANMSKVVNGMSSALATMTPENMATNLQNFEDLSDTLEVNADFMNMMIDKQTGPGQTNEVGGLLEEMAAELNIENLEGLETTAGLPNPLTVKPEAESAEREGVHEI